MAIAELSLIRFGVLNFFHLVMTSLPFYPVTTKLLKMMSALINSEPVKNEEIEKKINWIRENIHEKIMMPISIIEYIVFNNIGKTKNFDREIDIKHKSFHLIFLYKVLDDISNELTTLAVEIAKRYSLDMPILNYGSQQAKTTIEI
jgi:hypothetical protein